MDLARAGPSSSITPARALARSFGVGVAATSARYSFSIP
jgi:hypothetical protein